MLACCSVAGNAQSIETLTTGDAVDVAFHHYPASGTRLLVWWPSEHGVENGYADVASQLSQTGTEVWIADPFVTWFLPTLRASLAEIPRQTCGAFLLAASKHSGKRLFVMGSGRGAAVLLECLRYALAQGLEDVGGVLLISPNLFARASQPGQRRQLTAIAASTNFPVFVVFAEKSIEQLYRDDIVGALSQGGSRVYHTLVQGVRNRFYYRPDAVEVETRAAQQLSRIVQRSIELLSHDKGPRGFTQVRDQQREAGVASRKLVRYEGPQHGRLRLPGLDGRIHDVADYLGDVLLVSFWASWCPPCVHELPSMVRLQEAMAERQFRVLAVNLDEETGTINDFLRTRPVNFPVLLDVDLHYARRWQVSAFPSSFLLDGSGKIRYAVAGAIEWDSAHIIDTITGLLSE